MSASDIVQRTDIQWSLDLENYLRDIGEKASCLSWLHKHAEQMYSYLSVWIDIPVIVVGSINGAISVGSSSLFGDAQFASVGIGCVALIGALLTTIGSYFAWARRSESHKNSSLAYAKLFRFLAVELSLPRCERMTAPDILKYVKHEYDRLSEISPLVPVKIIETFRQRFASVDVAKPEECNGLHHIHIHKSISGSPRSLLPGNKPEIMVETDERAGKYDDRTVVQSVQSYGPAGKVDALGTDAVYGGTL
jgi:hypothetical protein